MLDDGDYLGMCNCIYKNNPIITIYCQSNEKYTLEELVTIIHELGHAIDFKNLSLSSTSNTLEKYLITSKLSEFNSQFYEKQAYEYFLEKGIDKNSNLANFIAFYTEIYNKIMGIRTYGFNIKTMEELNIEPQEINKVIKKEIDRLRKF